MRERINHTAGRVALMLSIVALGTVLVGLTQSPDRPPADEGTLAHLFHLAVHLLALTLLVFLATVEWAEPTRSMRPLIAPGVVILLAFSLLYYMEHVRRPPARTSADRPSTRAGSP